MVEKWRSSALKYDLGFILNVGKKDSLVYPLAKQLVAIGFPYDYHLSYNMIRNAMFVIDNITNISIDDLKWICNQIPKHIKGKECISDQRICAKGSETYYRKIQAYGCCGFYDVELTNPKTGNTFLFGFNYGH